MEKKRSIRTREAAEEEYDDDSDDGNESGSDDDARTTARRATERTEQGFQPLAFALCVGTEKLVPSRV